MAIEILALIEGIAKVAPALSKILDTLKDKQKIKGDELVQLKTEIENILEKMDYVAKIGGILEEYFKYYSDSFQIYATSKILHDTVDHYNKELSAGNEIYWKVVVLIFSDISRLKSAHLNVILNRITYLNNRDAEQVRIYVDEFNTYYQKANTYCRDKNVKEFLRYIDDMSRPAKNLREIFLNSINDIAKRLSSISIKRG